MQSRGYQTAGLDEIREHFRKGIKKVLLHLATGGGKTFMFCKVLTGAYKKGNSALMVVRGRKLVDQASQRLVREGVPHGVLMAKHWNYRPHERIQVCSIDTLRARRLKPKADLIVIDEAHLATSKSYIDFLAQYPDIFMLPVTATPYMDKSLSHCAQVVVHPISVQELIDQGFLVPPRYFAPSIPDTSKIKIDSFSKDFNRSQLEAVMDESALVGDIVSHWKEISPGKPTLCFAVSVAHSKHIVKEFNDAGIKAIHCDADSPDAEREAAIQKLQSGEISILSNVGLFCIGVDIPFLACIIMARPTKSYNLYVQQAGRGTRPCKETGKENFIILDHAGNVLNHGFITEEREANIDPLRKSNEKFKLISPKVCKHCYAIFKGVECPQCGFRETAHSSAREFAHIDGKLKELTDEPFETKVKRFIDEKKKIAKTAGYKRGWVYYQLIDEYGQEIADKYMPKRRIPEWVMSKWPN